MAHQLTLCLTISHPTTIEASHEETKPEKEEKQEEETEQEAEQDLDDFDLYHPEFDEPIINLKNKMLLENMQNLELRVALEKTDLEVKEAKIVKRVKKVKKGVKKKEKEKEERKEKECKRKMKGFKKFFASEDDYTKFENTYNIGKISFENKVILNRTNEFMFLEFSKINNSLIQTRDPYPISKIYLT